MQNFLNDPFYSSLLTEPKKILKKNLLSAKIFNDLLKKFYFPAPHFKNVFLLFLIFPSISILPLRNAKINLKVGP